MHAHDSAKAQASRGSPHIVLGARALECPSRCFFSLEPCLLCERNKGGFLYSLEPCLMCERNKGGFL